ncbi:MAG TPA: DUF3137 domain-containing protein [Blastocatellia bacterium]|nr:DUF3137 domain-containing protein [Blastocatellia bacterium]
MGFLRRLFGPSQDEVWRQFSDQIGAEFFKGSFFKGVSKVQATIEKAEVTLDTFVVSTGKSSVTYTRIRAVFLNKAGFRFTIYRKGLFSGLGKLLGMQDIEVGGPKFERLEPLFGTPGYLDEQIIESGSPEFDRDFIIKANDESKARSIFKQLKIRELIDSQPSIFLQLRETDKRTRERLGSATDELYFQEVGVIKDPSRLGSLFELYREILKTLRNTGS